jgi:hypothetical protein
MQSHDNIQAIAEEVAGGAAASSERASASSLRPRPALTSVVPSQPTARLVRPTASIATQDSLAGGGLGDLAGNVVLLGSHGDVALPIARWSASEITFEVPQGASSGLVALETAAHQLVVAGLLGIVKGTPDSVRSLKRKGGPLPYHGERGALVVEARNRRRRPVAGARVLVLLDGKTFGATTDGRGRATFHLKGIGCEPSLAFTSSASVEFSACWRPAPRQTMKLRVRKSAGHSLVTVHIAHHGPLAGEVVEFRLVGPRCARLGAKRRKTDAKGDAAVTATNRCGAAVTVEAIANHGGLTASVSVPNAKHRRRGKR